MKLKENYFLKKNTDLKLSTDIVTKVTFEINAVLLKKSCIDQIIL